MKNNVTMEDIAKKLKISKVTVSKALSDKEGVSEELKKIIKQTSEEMGYRYNTMAKSMKNGCSYNIGVIVAEHFVNGTPSFYLDFYKYISLYLEGYDYYGILQVLSQVDEENLNLPKIYYEKKVDGLIILGQISKEYIEILKSIDIPVIFLDFYDENDEFDSIIVDNFFSSYEITNYLIKKGHKEIGFVGDIYATSSIQDRFLGYYKSLLEHYIVLNNDYVINDRDETGRYIELSIPKKIPTAFVCNNDVVGYNLINKLKDLGYKVPEDVSVVAFDNTIYATICEPNITSIAIDTEEMAKNAVKIIISKLKRGNKKNGRVSVKGNAIYRDSVTGVKQSK
jgi:LacI family transcriptional regulator